MNWGINSHKHELERIIALVQDIDKKPEISKEIDMEAKFWEKPLAELSRKEWEALCDGCGLCCINKVEDEDTGEIFFTNVACNLLDLKTCQCRHYPTRHEYVPECIELSIKDIDLFGWLPQTCAYRLRHENQPLPSWHYLISGDRTYVQKQKALKGIPLIHERQMKMHKSLEDYVVDELSDL